MNPLNEIIKLLGKAYKGGSKTILNYWTNSTISKIDKLQNIEKENEIRDFKNYRTVVYKHIEDLWDYAYEADESYNALVYYNLTSVPAYDMHDNSYIDELQDIKDAVAALNTEDAPIDDLKEINLRIPELATKIQTYLNEPTSDLDNAELWDAKIRKASHDHLLFGNNDEDAVLSEVMSAFRNWQSTNQISIDLFGSKNLINATYEAVLEGQDAMTYMQRILDLNTIKDGRISNGRDIKVPFTGFFGSSFFM